MKRGLTEGQADLQIQSILVSKGFLFKYFISSNTVKYGVLPTFINNFIHTVELLHFCVILKRILSFTNVFYKVNYFVELLLYNCCA